MTAEPKRLSEFSLGLDSDGDAAAEESGPDGGFDMDERAREDAGGRAMDAIKAGDTKRFVDAMRDLMPFLKD